MDWHPGNFTDIPELADHPAAQAIERDASSGVELMYDAFAAMTQAGQAAAREALSRGENRKAMVGGRPVLLLPADLGERFYEASRRAFDKAAAKNQAAIDKMDAHASRLDAEIGQALTGPDKHGAEIRAHLRGLSETERLKVLASAVSSGDKETIAAISAGPSYLAGLDPKDVAMHRDAAAQQWAPAVYKAKAAVGDMRKRLESAAQSFGKRAAELKEQHPIASTDKAAQSKLDELEGLA